MNRERQFQGQNLVEYASGNLAQCSPPTDGLRFVITETAAI